jgi:hypothetical protein
MANTTPPRAHHTGRVARAIRTPLTVPCSTINDSADACSHRSTPLAKAVLARRAIKALPRSGGCRVDG